MFRVPAASADIELLSPLWREPVNRTVMANGLTLITKRDNSADVASVQVWVKTGSIHEGEHLGAGLSHYLEHMLFKGTERRAGRQISETVQAHGGYINAYTTFDRTVYYIDLPAAHTEVAVDLLADTILHSTLPADEVAREKDVILREIAMGLDDPDHRHSEALFETTFRTHPYRYPVIGYRDVFAAVTREDLLEYYQSRYVPNNLVVVVVGNIEPDAVEAMVARHFGATPRRRLAPVVLPAELPQLAPRQRHMYEDVGLTRAGLCWPVPGLTHVDAPALDLLAIVLGGGDSSLLWQELREQRRLVHAIDTSCWNPGSHGLFYVSYTCDGPQREEAAEAVERVLDHILREGVAPTLLQRAIRQQVVSEINGRKTMAGQAGRLGLAEVVAGDLDFAPSYFAELAQVTSDDIQRVIRTWLRRARRSDVSLNPLADRPTMLPASRNTAADLAARLVTLPNGVRIVLQPREGLPKMHLRALMQSGALYEPVAQRGISGLLATLLTKDTQHRDASAVAAGVEDLGGVFFPFVGNNSCGIALEVLSSDWADGLRCWAEGLTEPKFVERTLETEVESMIAELKQAEDDVVTRARRRLRATFFGEHPLAVDAGGREADLASLTVADVTAQYKRVVVGGNLVVVVTGDFEVATMEKALGEILAVIPAGQAVPQVEDFTAPAAQREVRFEAAQQAVVQRAYPGVGRLDPAFHVAEGLDELFSGMASRLFERVREEKGLAYFVRSGQIVGLHTGMFTFLAGTVPGAEDEVLGEIAAEVLRVQSGELTVGEWARCQTRLKAARRMSLQTMSSRAMTLGLDVLSGLPVDHGDHYDARIDAITLADLQAFAVTHFREDAICELVVRPPETQ